MAKRIAHLLVADSVSSICQSPAFPTLGEFSGTEAFIYSDGFEVCNLDPCQQPGDRMVVETNVLVRRFVAGAPPLVEELSTQSKFAAVKIMVNSCSGDNRRIIDVGYPIVVDGPQARLAVLAPAFAGAWDLGRGAPPPFLFEEAWEVMVYARACPARCCYPPLPQLTHFRQVDAGLPNTALTFVVPRGAREMILGSVPAGPTTLQFWTGDPNSATAFQMGQQPIVPSAVFGSPTELSIFGSPSHVLFTPAPTAPGFLYFRWTIGD